MLHIILIISRHPVAKIKLTRSGSRRGLNSNDTNNSARSRTLPLPQPKKKKKQVGDHLHSLADKKETSIQWRS